MIRIMAILMIAFIFTMGCTEKPQTNNNPGLQKKIEIAEQEKNYFQQEAKKANENLTKLQTETKITLQELYNQAVTCQNAIACQNQNNCEIPETEYKQECLRKYASDMLNEFENRTGIKVFEE